MDHQVEDHVDVEAARREDRQSRCTSTKRGARPRRRAAPAPPGCRTRRGRRPAPGRRRCREQAVGLGRGRGAIGFSTSTWRPRSSSAQPTSAWLDRGHRDHRRLDLAGELLERGKTRAAVLARPRRSADLRRARRRPRPARRPASDASRRTWWRPSAPVPTTPTRSGRPTSIGQCPALTRAAASVSPGSPRAAALALDHAALARSRRSRSGSRPRGALGQLRAAPRAPAPVFRPERSRTRNARSSRAMRLGVDALALEADAVEAVAGRLLAHRLDERQRVQVTTE